MGDGLEPVPVGGGDRWVGIQVHVSPSAGVGGGQELRGTKNVLESNTPPT